MRVVLNGYASKGEAVEEILSGLDEEELDEYTGGKIEITIGA